MRKLFEARAAVLEYEAKQHLIEKEIELERLKQRRLPLSDEMRKQMKEQRCDSMEMRSAFIDGWLSAEAAHGIKGEA